MIKNFDKKSNLDTKYIPNYRIIRIISPRQLEVSNPTDRLWKVNVSDVHKILPSESKSKLTEHLSQQLCIKKDTPKEV